MKKVKTSHFKKIQDPTKCRKAYISSKQWNRGQRSNFFPSQIRHRKHKWSGPLKLSAKGVKNLQCKTERETAN